MDIISACIGLPQHITATAEMIYISESSAKSDSTTPRTYVVHIKVVSTPNIMLNLSVTSCRGIEINIVITPARMIGATYAV